MTINALNSIQPEQKWIITDSKICCVSIKRGKLKNLYDFNKVVLFATKEIQCQKLGESAPLCDKVLERYDHIKQAIHKKPTIIRLFLTIILKVQHLDDHIEKFKQAIQHPNKIHQVTTPITPAQQTPHQMTTNPSNDCLSPLISNNTTFTTSISPIAISSKKINTPLAAKLRAGFANGGSTCFIATALQSLNLLSNLLPKDVDNELKQKIDESTDDFAKRKHLAKAVLKLLDKSNQQGPQEPIDGSETVKLRDLLHEFSKGSIKSGEAGDANEVLRNFFQIFNLPSHQKSNATKSRWTPFGDIASTESFDSWKDKHTMQPGGICKTHFDIRGTGKDSNQLPSFFCLQFYGDKKNIEVEVPKALVFSSSDEPKYYLVGCAIGGGGHAYAYVKENDQWIKYNDGHVGVVDTSEAENDMKHNRTAFIFKTRD